MKTVLFAFVAGMVTGILIAPQRGTETRRKIKKIYDDAQEGLKNLPEKAAEKVEDLAAKVDEKIQASV